MGPPWRAGLPHWIRPVVGGRFPATHMVFDCEAHVHTAGPGELHRWRLGVLSRDTLDASGHAARPTDYLTCHTPRALWEQVSAWAPARARSVLVAHNLAYDLRVSHALRELPALGWQLEAIQLERQCSFARWRQGDRTLVMVDLYSWLPMPLSAIGKLVGLPKGKLPPPDASRETWEAYCRRDVEITRAAWLAIQHWLRAEGLGSFQATGAAQAWHAWRCRFMGDRVLAPGAASWRAAERESAWAGRSEAWRIGDFRGGPYYEWDFSNAYGTIAASTRLPVRLVGLRRRMSPAACATPPDGQVVCAEVTVTTEVPCVPTRWGEHVIWPVGTFRTRLWTPELRLALAEGADVAVHAAQVYIATPVLQRFARWALDLTARGGGDYGPVVGAVAKHWTRVLVGRFAMRYRRWEYWGDAHREDCLVSEMADLRVGVRGQLLWLGRSLFELVGEEEADDGAPAIMAYVMSVLRVKLWEAMRTAGFRHLLYVGTDSLLVTPGGNRALQRALGEGRLSGLRPKAAWRRVRVWGPKALATEDQIRVAGLPKRAWEQAPGSFLAEVWRTLPTALAVGEADTVRVWDRLVRLRGTDHRRHHHPDGSTCPLRLPEGVPSCQATASASPPSSHEATKLDPAPRT